MLGMNFEHYTSTTQKSKELNQGAGTRFMSSASMSGGHNNAGVTGVEILKENLSFETLREKIIEKDSNGDEVKEKVLETKAELAPIRGLMLEFVTMLANLESMGNKTSQEKFLAVRVKLIELQNKIQKFSKDFQQLQPLIQTMERFNEELAGEKRYFVQETLGYTSVNPASASAGGTSVSTSASAQSKTTKKASGGRRNSAKKSNAVSASSTPNLKQIPNNQPQQQQPQIPQQQPQIPQQMQIPMQMQMQMMPGVSPMAMASPLNNISPQRKLATTMNQSRENSLHQNQNQGQTPAGTMITPQNILNMSTFDMNQNQTPQPPNNINNMDLANLDLDSLNMEFLN